MPPNSFVARATTSQLHARCRSCGELCAPCFGCSYRQVPLCIARASLPTRDTYWEFNMQNQETRNLSSIDTAEQRSGGGMMAATAGALEGAATGIERAGHGVGDRVASAADRTAFALLSGAEKVRDMKSGDLGSDVMRIARRHPAQTIAALAAVAALVIRGAMRR